MSEPGRAVPTTIQAQRDTVIARLCEHFAQDHITEVQLESLIDRAHRATQVEQLRALLDELPALRGATVPANVPSAEERGGVPAERRQTVVAIMGGAERKGAWLPARTVHVFALMGGAVLDFRDVQLPPGRTDVEAVAIMGGVEIIVPPGLRVSSDGIGILGGFEHSGETSATGDDAGAPVLRVTGVALMGGVEITERRPGESEREAARRRRIEERSRR